MQTDAADTSIPHAAGVLEELAAALKDVRAAPANAQAWGAAVSGADCRLRAAQERLAGLPAEALADVLVRLAIAYSYLDKVVEAGDPQSQDLGGAG